MDGTGLINCDRHVNTVGEEGSPNSCMWPALISSWRTSPCFSRIGRDGAVQIDDLFRTWHLNLLTTNGQHLWYARDVISKVKLISLLKMLRSLDWTCCPWFWKAGYRSHGVSGRRTQPGKFIVCRRQSYSYSRSWAIAFGIASRRWGLSMLLPRSFGRSNPRKCW